MLKRILPGLLLSCLASSAVAATASTPLPLQAVTTTDQIIVKLKPVAQTRRLATSRQMVQGAIDTVGLNIHATYKRAMPNDTHVIQLPAPMTLQEATDYATLLSVDPTVEYAEPDQMMFPTTDVTPNDSAFANQWEHNAPNTHAGAMNLPAAWGETTGSSNVVVAVVDTGVVNHRDLAPRLIGGSATLAGYDFITPSTVGNDGDGRDSNPSDPGDWISAEDTTSSVFANCGIHNSAWHGTHVAGTIGAASNNAQGVAGVDWNARLLVARAMGKCGGYLSDITDAIRWSAGETVNGINNPTPANIINLSLGGSGTCGPTYQDAINAAIGRGAVVVTAAGNSNTDVSTHRPANCQNVITVTALEQNGGKASFTNTGNQVDIAAPGVSILSTLDGGKTSPVNDDAYAYYKGSSMATPHVSGVLALMLAANSHLTDGSIPPAELPSLLEYKLKAASRPFVSGTSSDCTTATCGTGALDAYRAVMAVKTPPTASAGANQSVQPGASVTLQGSGTDTTPAGSISRYRWEQTAGTPVTLSDRNAAAPTFVAPSTAETLAFRLTVTNNVGLSSSSYTNVTILAATSPCAPANLAVGGNASDRWSSDCTANHRSERYARYYTFTLTAPATIVAELASTQDTYLYLLQGNGVNGEVLTQNDDSNGTTNSRIERSLPAGTYTLETTTYYTKREGAFTLRLATVNAPAPTPEPCTIHPLVQGQAATGQWNSTCTSTHRGNTYYAGYYTFTLTAPADVDIGLNSSQQDTFLYLLQGNGSQGSVLASNDDSNGTTHSRIERSLPAGTYTLETTTYSPARTGTFSINVSVANAAASCTPSPLTIGVNTSGEWSANCVSSHRGNAYFATYHTFTLTAPTAMTFDLSSQQDTYLYLLEGNGIGGNVLTFNDDSNGVSNSQITRTLAAGAYTLEATTYTAGRTGTFTLRAH